MASRIETGALARKSLSHDTGLPVDHPSATEFSLGHNVSSKEEVDAVMKQSETAGSVIGKHAQNNTFYGGYAGYFKDLDGHSWEIA